MWISIILSPLKVRSVYLSTSTWLNEDTIFYSAIVDDPRFVDFIRRFTKNVPEKIMSKKELKMKLLQRISDGSFVENVLSSSRLPE